MILRVCTFVLVIVLIVGGKLALTIWPVYVYWPSAFCYLIGSCGLFVLMKNRRG